MPSLTTTYSFNLPLVNDPTDADLWGTELNANWTALDTLLTAAGISTVGALNAPDSTFRIVGSSDATKKLAFEVDGLTTATTRTLTVQDKTGTLPVIETADLSIPATSAGPSSLTLAEDTDNGANTVKIIAPASVSANATITLPGVSGTPALTNKFTGTVYVTGSGNWTSPADITSETVFKVTVTGGGAGGSSGGSVKGGGGAGGTCIKYVTGLTASTNYAYSVGAGGAAGAAGSDSTFTVGGTAYTGGGGGTSTTAAGGNGGTASNGDINIDGGDGAGANNGSNPPGHGGASFWGGGGKGTDSGAGANGKAYGSGGAGGTTSGAGKVGIILIERLG